MCLFKLVTVPIILSLSLIAAYTAFHEVLTQNRHHLHFHLFPCSKCVSCTSSCCRNIIIFGRFVPPVLGTAEGIVCGIWGGKEEGGGRVDHQMFFHMRNLSLKDF